MLIYERNGSICITFKSNKPVDAPEYVITVDKAAETVYVNGKAYVDPVDVVETIVEPIVEKPVAKKTAKVKVEEPAAPVIEEVDEPVAELVEE